MSSVDFAFASGSAEHSSRSCSGDISKSPQRDRGAFRGLTGGKKTIAPFHHRSGNSNRRHFADTDGTDERRDAGCLCGTATPRTDAVLAEFFAFHDRGDDVVPLIRSDFAASS